MFRGEKMTIYCEKLDTACGMFSEMPPVQGEFYLGEVTRLLPELVRRHAGSVQLIYLDPPFMTGRDFEAVMPVGESGYRGKREAFARIPLYSDKWEGKPEYLGFLKQILQGAKQLLREKGVLCLHVDRHISAYAKILLDEVFGEACFINEIIWHYRSGGSNKHAFPAKHDTLFLYGNAPGVKINPAAVGYRRSAVSQNHLKKQIDETGRVFFSIKSNGKEYRYYEDDIILYDDVWDIPHLQQKHPERTGYGTQKPLELLDRIICSCSAQGDTVCDLFAGSGTALVSAHNHGRCYVGVDQSPLSLLTLRRRLAEKENVHLSIYHTEASDDRASISIHRQELSGQLKITIDGYRILNLHAVVPKCGDGLQYITYWSAGRIEEDTFITEDYTMRTPQIPKLRNSLVIPEGDDKAIYFCDCIGNQRFIKI